jgi:hypothetical protein
VPRGTRFDALNLLWIDAEGATLPAAAHPLMRVLAGHTNDAGIPSRIGVVPPTGGTRWLKCSARPVSMPETHEVAALLVLTEEKDCGD